MQYLSGTYCRRMGELLSNPLTFFSFKPQLGTAFLFAAGLAQSLGQAAGIINAFTHLFYKERSPTKRRVRSSLMAELLLSRLPTRFTRSNCSIACDQFPRMQRSRSML
jgi:hypothetical protein